MAPVIFRRSAFLVAGRALGDILQLVLYIAIVRRFSDSEIGDYAFAFALALVLGSVVGLGARSLITREVANRPALGAAYPLNLAVMHGALTIMIGLGLLAYATLADFSPFLTMLCLLAFLAAGLNTIGFSAIAVVDAAGRVERGAQAEVIGKLAIFVLGFGALLAGLSLPFIMGAQVIGALCYLGFAVHLASQSFGPLARRVDVALILNTMRLSVPFLMAALLYALYARIDIVMLHHLVGAAETGQYAVGFRVIETSFVICSMVGIAIFPELAAGGRDGGPERRRLFGAACRWLAALGGLVSVGLMVAGDQLITLVFGADMTQAGDLLRVMALLAVIAYVKEPFWRLLIVQGREKLQMYIQGSAVILNIVLNLLLIPRYGAYGAVAASLISESLMLVGFAIAVSRQGLLSAAPIVGWFAAVLPAALLGFWLRGFMPPLAAAVLSVIVLCLFLFVLRIVRLSELPWLGARFGGARISSPPAKGVNNGP